MSDHQRFRIGIYRDGVVFDVRVRGKKKYLMYKAFLDELEGRRYHPDLLPRPVPDPGHDMYMLTKEQLVAFGRFTRNASRLARGFPVKNSKRTLP
jgi:hypothetical protein